MTWTIEYTSTARTQLRRLGKQMARRIVEYMDERVARLDDPRSMGKALTGPFGRSWRYRVGGCRVICDIQDGALRILAAPNTIRLPTSWWPEEVNEHGG